MRRRTFSRRAAPRIIISVEGCARAVLLILLEDDNDELTCTAGLPLPRHPGGFVSVRPCVTRRELEDHGGGGERRRRRVYRVVRRGCE